MGRIRPLERRIRGKEGAALMTATVTPPFIVDKFARTYSGDDRARFWHYLGSNTPGQLWQRVAETPLKASRRLGLANDRIRAREAYIRIDVMQGKPNRSGANGPRVMIDGEYTAPRHASGIIRAGRRVK
jgi:hypothetical protein